MIQVTEDLRINVTAVDWQETNRKAGSVIPLLLTTLLCHPLLIFTLFVLILVISFVTDKIENCSLTSSVSNSPLSSYSEKKTHKILRSACS